MSVLEIDEVSKTFHRGGRPVQAVRGASLVVEARETVGLVGESGSGKSTLGRLALRLLRPDSGSIRFQGRELSALSTREMRPLRADLQVVFQEPFQSLDPQLSVRASVAEPLECTRGSTDGAEVRRHVDEALELVGLGADKGGRYPAQLSGGEQQRVGIARAIVTRPDLVVLDEPTSSLDLSVRAGVISLLQQLQAELGMSYLFISHDLDTVGFLADRVYVMYRGQIVETGPAAEVLEHPRHPYTALLGAARLDVDPAVGRATPPRVRSERDLTPGGCPFLDRCERADDACEAMPAFDGTNPVREVACHHPLPATAGASTRGG